MLRRLYDWTMHWAVDPRARLALFLIALAEASFFPIPPDLLLIPMVLAAPSAGLVLAGICTVGSALGGALGYLIGSSAWEVIGDPIIQFYGAAHKYEQVSGYFNEYGIWIVAIAAFTPIPYKVITITAGAMGMPFLPFIITSILGRGARFYLVGGVLMWGGEPLRGFVDRRLGLLTSGLAILAIAMFLVIKLV